MSDSVTTRVEVALSPDAAFDVFTREIDAWYQVDHDTLPDITRTAAIRFEPHVGGRLLDVHDLATGAGRELGRITVWEPGFRLAFTDNEGTQVEVGFEWRGGGTRVTLTHRGLDRLAPNRASELRRSGWAALAPFYRDHVAPNARPLALAVAFQALLVLALVTAGAFTVGLAGGHLSAWEWALAWPFICAVGFAVLLTRDRLVRRWLPSEWQYRRIWHRLFGLLCLGVLIAGPYRVFVHGEDVLWAVGFPVVMLLACWSWEWQGPAHGGSLRARAGSAQTASARRLTLVMLCLALGVLAGLLAVLNSVEVIAGILTPAILVLWAAVSLYVILSKRRAKQAFGFDPDLYLAVARPVTESTERPELLVHHRNEQPEYSGWYAYASERDEGSDDLVAWSMKDLVDHAPEAARALREGHGKWKWDHAERAYRRLERR